MHFLSEVFYKLHHLDELIRWGGYAGMAAIIFSETGIMAGFFLPGDSLLVTAGLFAANGNLSILTLNALLIPMAILGDSVGYWIGLKVGPRIFSREKSLFFAKDHLLKTRDFYERHGGKTIILARFMPILRTFAPVVAGVGRMQYARFLSFNVFGGIGWVFSMTMIGYVLGRSIPNINQHIDLLVMSVIFLSILPGIISFLKNWKKNKAGATSADLS